LVGETHGRDPALAAACHGARGEGLHMAFNFEFLFRPWSAKAFRESARAWYAALPEGAWPNFTLSNHDQIRHARRFRKAGFTDARAKVAAAMLLTLRGSPFLYYGEELGMLGAFPRRSDLRDPLGIATWPLRAYGRDPERTPMQWDSSANAGFTEGKPWLPPEPGWRTRNVEAEERDPESVLSFYKALLALRRSRPELALGSLAFVGEDPDLLVYERRGEEGPGKARVLVVLNFASRRRNFTLPSGGSVLLGTHRKAGARILAGSMELSPCEVLLLAVD
ncbi:MAG TPA: alpha-amylase family glycosyl hydrolase, partial [Spirochaetales bacterium]|nr:alpha-amylase family glycosyl hydrolase [Spirochaetales bacterium]